MGKRRNRVQIIKTKNTLIALLSQRGRPDFIYIRTTKDSKLGLSYPGMELPEIYATPSLPGATELERLFEVLGMSNGQDRLTSPSRPGRLNRE